MLFYFLGGHIQRDVFLQGFSCYQIQEKVQCPWNKEHPLLLFMCLSACEYHFFFMRLSCQDWFCVYQLWVTLDWIIAVDYDFFKNLFQLQKLSQASLCRFLCHCCHLREVFSIAGWAFFNVDEFQQPGDEQNMCILHIITRTQSEWHRVKVCTWGAFILLGIF